MKTLIMMALSVAAFSTQTAKAERISVFKAQNIVRVLYRAALFREVDVTGLRTWTRAIVNNGVNGLTEVAYGIGNSPEFQQKVQQHTASVVLSTMYQEILGRDIDQAAFSGWLPLINQGRGGDVLNGIVRSQEFLGIYVY